MALPHFQGIFPPLVTPLSAPDKLDVAGLERLIEHVLSGGVHGLFILGTTGEAPSLDHNLRKELIQRTCRQVRDRVPVLVGITDTAIVEAKEMSRLAANYGASAVVLAPPYYFPNSQTELVEYIERLAPELPLPLVLYNMPTHTKTMFELGSLQRLMEVDNIIGFKDSSGNMVYYHQVLSSLSIRPDWSVLMGPEELLGEAVLFGGHGGVCGGANLCPQLYVDLYEAARWQNIERVLDLHRRVMRISSTIYRVGKYGSSFIKGLKCSLSLLGICDDFMSEPFHRFYDVDRARLHELLEELGVTVSNPYPASDEAVVTGLMR